MFGGTRAQDGRSEMCYPEGDPSFSSEKMGTRDRSCGSSAKKMGFSLCHSGILEMGSVACMGRRSDCATRYASFARHRGVGNSPSPMSTYFSPQHLDFLAKCCNLEITRKYSLNSLACLLLTCPEVFCSIAACSNAEMQLCLCSDSQSDGTFSE